MTPRLEVLVVEDDPGVAAQLQKGLDRAGLSVQVATTLGSARAALDVRRYDLVLLDITLPDGSGQTLLEHLALASDTPVIVLSARTDPRTRVAVFGAGAVDYVPKPFWMDELVHRIRLRTGTPAPGWSIGDVTAHPEAGTVTRGDQLLALSPTERAILFALGREAGRVVSRRRLAELLEGDDGPPTERSVDSYVARLRKKLGPLAAARLRTVLGLGYRLDPEPG